MQQVEDAQALELMTKWNDIVDADFAEIAELTRLTRLLFDVRNAMNPRELHEYGFAYKGIGRGTWGSVRAQVLGAPLSPCAERLKTQRGAELELGTFSVSLAVKDMEKSLDFYEKFGFKVIDGVI